MERKELGLTDKDLKKLKEDVTDPEVEKELEQILAKQKTEQVNEPFEEAMDDIKEEVAEGKEKMQTIDFGKLWNEYVKWGNQEANVKTKADYCLSVTIHAGMTLLTAGLWFLGLVAYWGYLFKKDLDRRDADISTEWEKKEE